MGKKLSNAPLLPLLTLARSLLSFRTRIARNPCPSDQRPALFRLQAGRGSVRGPTDKECARAMRDDRDDKAHNAEEQRHTPRHTRIQADTGEGNGDGEEERMSGGGGNSPH